ncbi:MAG: MopE-related protein [Myxococcota bacterium]|nr:MopE-related protein [Myxococcota bacterium]
MQRSSRIQYAVSVFFGLLMVACGVGEVELGENWSSSSAVGPCHLGEQRACVLGEGMAGACSAGYQTCVQLGDSLAWGACAPAPLGEPELCGDGIDNNCNGSIDEFCERQEYIMTRGDEVFVVGPGQVECSDIEVCDNALDDDCDGEVDEGCVAEDGACVPLSIGACVTSCGSTGYRFCDFDAAWMPCRDAGEICGSGMDDDCDGLTDEDCCEAGSVEACQSACGSQGSRSCSAEGVQGACVPPLEVCDNGLDDDCDGQVDENCDSNHDWPVIDCTDHDFGHCNTDMGYGDRCAESDNSNGCTDESFQGWCNRRNPETPTLWDDTVRGWVEERCDGGSVRVDGATYYCENSTQKVIYQCTTPLVLSFDGSAVKYAPLSAVASFSLEPGQPMMQHDWPSVAYPWLAFDRNENGSIDDGSELFGSSTLLATGRKALHGFEALAELDDNRDGVLDAGDASWSKLLVWRDVDADRRSRPEELRPVGAEGLVQIELQHRVELRCDENANCERERAAFIWRSPQGELSRGEVIDIHLMQRRVLYEM